MELAHRGVWLEEVPEHIEGFCGGKAQERGQVVAFREARGSRNPNWWIDEVVARCRGQLQAFRPNSTTDSFVN